MITKLIWEDINIEIKDTCHQYDMRKDLDEVDDHPKMTREELNKCTVQKLTRDVATPIILKYEWLKTVNASAIAFYGLITETGEIAGVTVFEKGPGTDSHLLCGKEYKDKTICLARGTCVNWAHEHAGSYFIPKALEKAHEDYGWSVFFAYSDIAAGEIGTIYQATNWHFLGFGNGRSRPKGKVGGRPEFVNVKTGEKVSSRIQRSRAKKDPDYWSLPAIRANPDWKEQISYDKGRYVQFVGNKREKKAMIKALRYPIQKEYPKRYKSS